MRRTGSLPVEAPETFHNRSVRRADNPVRHSLGDDWAFCLEQTVRQLARILRFRLLRPRGHLALLSKPTFRNQGFLNRRPQRKRRFCIHPIQPHQQPTTPASVPSLSSCSNRHIQSRIQTGDRRGNGDSCIPSIHPHQPSIQAPLLPFLLFKFNLNNPRTSDLHPRCILCSKKLQASLKPSSVPPSRFTATRNRVRRVRLPNGVSAVNSTFAS